MQCRNVSDDHAAAADGFAVGWLAERFALNFAVAFAYYAFFFTGLYVFKMSGRKVTRSANPPPPPPRFFSSMPKKEPKKKKMHVAYGW